MSCHPHNIAVHTYMTQVPSTDFRQDKDLLGRTLEALMTPTDSRRENCTPIRADDTGLTYLSIAMAIKVRTLTEIVQDAMKKANLQYSRPKNQS